MSPKDMPKHRPVQGTPDRRPVVYTTSTPPRKA